jgi:beta-galactosidase
VFNYFLNDFGSELAPMSAHAPDTKPSGPDDLGVIRAAVRSQGSHGFLFVNNYVRGYTTPERKAVQFRIQLPHASVALPEKPVDIPSGAYFIWPFNLDLGAATLRYSTAQLFARLTGAAQTTWFFEEIPGIPVELAFDDAPGLSIHASGVAMKKSGGIVTLSNIPSGMEHAIRLQTATGPGVRLVVMTQHEAENTWKAEIGGEEHLVETDQSYYGDATHFYLQSMGKPEAGFRVYPEVSSNLSIEKGKLRVRTSNGISDFMATVPPQHIAIQLKQVQQAGEAPPVRLGPSFSWRPHGVAEAPAEAAFATAAKWQIGIPQGFLKGVSNVFLDVDSIGDVAHLTVGGKLLDDHFYNGLPWEIGLRRFESDIGQTPLELAILPLRSDAPIYLQEPDPPHFGSRKQLVSLKRVRAVPEYEFTIRTSR